MSDIEYRVMELEIKSAHQEDTIEQLNHIIIEQQNSINGMVRQLELLQDKLSSLQNSSEKETIEAPPPHY